MPSASWAIGALLGRQLCIGAGAVGASPAVFTAIFLTCSLSWVLATEIAGRTVSRRTAPLVVTALVSATLLSWPAPAIQLVHRASQNAGLLPDQPQFFGLGLLFAMATITFLSAASFLWCSRSRPSMPAIVIGLLSAPLFSPFVLVPLATLLSLLPALGISRLAKAAATAASVFQQDPTTHRRLSGFKVASAYAAALGVGWVWCHARSWLDPTPLGFLAATSAALFAHDAGRLVTGSRLPFQRYPRSSPGWWAPFPIALSLLVAYAIVNMLPALGAPLLSMLSTQTDPRPALTGLLALSSSLPAFFAGLSAPRGVSGSTSPRGMALLVLVAGVGFAAAVASVGTGTWLVLPLVGLFGVLYLVFGKRTGRRLAGAGIVLLPLLVWYVFPQSPSRAFLPGLYTSLRGAQRLSHTRELLEQSTYIASGIDSRGAFSLRALDDDLVLDSDGTPVGRQGRFARSVAFAAHLGAMLAHDDGRYLLLGDDTSLGIESLLAHDPRTLDVAVPQPEAIRAMVREQNSLEPLLLAPAVHLWPVSPARLALESGRQDLILHLVNRSWMDAVSLLPGRYLFRTVSGNLAPGGVYVAVVSLEWWSVESLRRILRLFADIFPGATCWLPPVGADQLIVVGSNETSAISIPGLRERMNETTGLGTLLGSVIDVADRAVLSPSGMWNLIAADSSTLGSIYRPPGSSGLWLPDVLGKSPALVLPELLTSLSEPEEIFDPGNDPAIIQLLKARQNANRTFMDMLRNSGKGDMEALFQQAADLRRSAIGGRRLDSLIQPHLAEARKAMEIARKEGSLSAAWSEADNQLTLARLLNPESTEVALLLAEVQEARGNVSRAEEQYRWVLERAPGSLQALNGLARIRSARGDMISAEQILRKAVQEHPNEWTCHQNLGVLLLKAQKLQQAEKALRKAASLADSTEAAPWGALAEVHLAWKRFDAALVEAERTVRLSPSAYHYFLRGRAYYELGQDERAEHDFREAVLRDPDFYLARGGLGQILATRGELDAAEKEFMQVLAKDPGNTPARLNLQQIEELRRAESKAPESAHHADEGEP